MPANIRNQRVVVSAGFGIFQRVVQLAATLVVVPLVLRALGTSAFGIWGAAASLAWLAGVVDIGTGYALINLVARSMAGERPHEAATHIAGAVTVGVFIGAPALLVVAALWAGGDPLALGGAFLIALAGLALNIPVSSANMAWMGLQEGYFSSLWELVQTLVSTAGLCIAAATTRQVWVYVAVTYGSIVLANLGSLVHLYVRHPELRPAHLSVSWAAMREVAFGGAALFAMMMAGSLTYLLDNVLALRLLGAEASARMAIAMRICITVIGMLVTVSQPLWPAFTEAAHLEDRRWIVRNALRSAALILAAAAAGGALLVLFGQRLFSIWLHAQLPIDQMLLWAVAVWIFCQAMVRIPFLLLNALSQIRFQTVLFAVCTAIAFVLKFALAGRMGVAGILWATSLTVALIVFPGCLWRLVQVWRHPELVRAPAGGAAAQEAAGHLPTAD